MRTPLRLLTLLFLLILVLSSCTSERALLPPEEVLRRASEVAQDLQSVAFDADVNVAMESNERKLLGKGIVRGRMQNGGEQMQFTLAFQGEILSGPTNMSINGVVEIIVAGNDETYLKIHTLAIDPVTLALPQELQKTLAESWLSLPSVLSSESTLRITPDPAVLRAQAGVVRVSRDFGIDSIGGKRAYHYEVTLDPEKLLGFLQRVSEEQQQPFDARGELWIDAKTFVLRRIRWSVSLDRERTVSTFRVDLSDHGAVDPILPPKTQEVFGSFPLANTFPFFTKGGSGMLFPDL